MLFKIKFIWPYYLAAGCKEKKETIKLHFILCSQKIRTTCAKYAFLVGFNLLT